MAVDLVGRLAAYVPEDRRRALALGRDLPEETSGTALFADLSGFTPLSDALARAYGPRRGAEELTATMDRVFGELVAASDRRDGSVLAFTGDAITAWFDGDAGDRALVAAIEMRDLVAGLAPIAIPGSASIRLGIKVTLAAGPVRRLLLGDPAIRRFDVIAGSTVDRLARAAEATRTGEILADSAVVSRFRGEVRETGRRTVGEEPYAVIEAADLAADETAESSDGRGPDGSDVALALAVEPDALQGWLPAPIVARLEAGAEALLAELRPAVAVFVRLGVLDLDDPAVTARLDGFVRWSEDVIERHGGTVMDVATGEKGGYLSVIFGAPIAHDDDALRAVAAARVLVEAPETVALPAPVAVGIAAGRVCVGVFGGLTRRTYGLQGIEVSVAARLMQRAESGQIVVSERVARAIEGRSPTRPLGAVSVKGLPAPLEVHEIVGAGGAIQETRASFESSGLVGRQAELERLESLLRAARAGSGRAVVIRGEPGVGKSRLVAALIDDAASTGLRVLQGAATSIEQAAQYSAWRSVFGQLFDLPTVGADAAIASAVGMLSERDCERAALLGVVLPGAPPETEATRQLDPAARQDETQRLLLQVLVAQRGDEATVIVLDDAQWLDSASWSFLRRVARSLERLLVVVVGRSGDGTPDEIDAFVEAAGAERMEVQPLPAAEALALVRRALGVQSLPDSVAAFVASRAEGHPLFSVELGRALRDAGILEVSGGAARLREGVDLARLEFPESIEGLVTIRIDRLSAEVQDLLKIASVINDDFEAFDIAELADLDSDRVVAGLAELEALDLVVHAPVRPGAYAFRHVLIRDAAYGRLLFAQRRRLHRIVAERLERLAASEADAAPTHAVLAHHWEAAGASGRAIAHLEIAGEKALRDGAFPECARLLGRALELAAAAGDGSAATAEDVADGPAGVDPVRKAGWEWQAAQAMYRLGELDRSRELAEAALAAFDRPLPAGRARTVAAILREALRQLAHRILPRRFVGTAAPDARDRVRYATRAYFNLAEVYYLASEPERSALAALRGLNLAERLGPSPELVEAYGAICIIGGLLGRHPVASLYARLGLAAAAAIDDRFSKTIIVHQVGLYRSGTGPAEPLLGDFERAIQGFRDIGDKGRLRDCLGIAAIAAYLFGRTDECERRMGELLGTQGEGERALPGVWALTWLGASALRRGDPETAIGLLHRAASSGLGSEGLDMTSITLHGLLALAFRRTGRLDEARGQCQRARALIAETGGRPAGHPVLDGYVALAELALADWDDAGARDEAGGRLAEEAVGYLDAYRRIFPIGVPAWRRYAGEVAARRGRERVATRQFEAAADAAEKLDMWPEMARAHAALAAVLPAGDPEHVRHGAIARQVFEKSGMAEATAEGRPI